MAERVLITAALAGNRVFKEHNPNVPYPPKELIDEAIRRRKSEFALTFRGGKRQKGVGTRWKEL